MYPVSRDAETRRTSPWGVTLDASRCWEHLGVLHLFSHSVSSQAKTTFSNPKKQKLQGWSFLKAKSSKVGEKVLQPSRGLSLLRGPQASSSPPEGLVRIYSDLPTLPSLVTLAARSRVTPLPRPGHPFSRCAPCCTTCVLMFLFMRTTHDARVRRSFTVTLRDASMKEQPQWRNLRQLACCGAVGSFGTRSPRQYKAYRVLCTSCLSTHTHTH